MQCTSPLLDYRDIDGTVAKLTPGVDMAICVLPFHGIICDAQGPINFHPSQSPNRQQRQPQWVVSGHCWALRPEYLQRPWMSGTLAYHPAQTKMHLEIDTPEDWLAAERMLAQLDTVDYPK